MFGENAVFIYMHRDVDRNCVAKAACVQRAGREKMKILCLVNRFYEFQVQNDVLFLTGKIFFNTMKIHYV